MSTRDDLHLTLSTRAIRVSSMADSRVSGYVRYYQHRLYIVNTGIANINIGADEFEEVIIILIHYVRI